MRLQDQVAIVTGVSGGGQVGITVAEALAREGARLVVAARSEEKVEARAEELRRNGADVLAVAADLTQEAEVQHLCDRTLERFGRIDVLVNLAGGLTVYKPAKEHSLADWDREINNNLRTAFLMSRAVFPIMVEAGGGRIINFSRAGEAQANMLAYNCAKAGINALTRTFALEGREHNIRVNAIAPGLVETETNLQAMKPKDTSRWTRRENLAAAVVFLASEESHGITGQIVQVAGFGI